MTTTADDIVARCPTLRRNELTFEAKRWQLWGKGVRGADADAILRLLYPNEFHMAEIARTLPRPKGAGGVG